jgi:hypothetical protein
MIRSGGSESVAIEARRFDASRPAGQSGGRPIGPTPARTGIRSKTIRSILLFAAGRINILGKYICLVRHGSSSWFVARPPYSLIN